MAEIELREYDALAELPRLLIPNRARGESPINLTHHWTDLKLRRPSRYLPVVALANHSAMATAGSTERYFRAVSFINDLKRTAQKPSTIKRLSYLQSNPEHMPFSTEIMKIYKERIIQRKQRQEAQMHGTRLRVDSDEEEDQEDELDEDVEPPPAFDDDPDVERPRFTFQEFMTGFDMDELMKWAGLRAAEARGAGGGGAGGVGDSEGGDVATPARADEATATTTPPADARAANEADGRRSGARRRHLETTAV